MKVSLAHALGAFSAGLLFGVGLVLSGMTQPQKVLGFLDVFGRFDPSLLLVMGGAVGVHALAYRLITRRNTPLFASHFALPTRSDVDAKLLPSSKEPGLAGDNPRRQQRQAARN